MFWFNKIVWYSSIPSFENKNAQEAVWMQIGNDRGLEGKRMCVIARGAVSRKSSYCSLFRLIEWIQRGFYVLSLFWAVFFVVKEFITVKSPIYSFHSIMVNRLHWLIERKEFLRSSFNFVLNSSAISIHISEVACDILNATKMKMRLN